MDKATLEAVCEWLRRHPLYTVGLHGQKREGLPTGWYLAEEIEDGYFERGAYREVTRK